MLTIAVSIVLKSVLSRANYPIVCPHPTQQGFMEVMSYITMWSPGLSVSSPSLLTRAAYVMRVSVPRDRETNSEKLAHKILCPLWHHNTEWVGLAVPLFTCIREILDSNLGRDTGKAEWGFLYDFPLSLQDNSVIYLTTPPGAQAVWGRTLG
jgi:hypothetical protein